MIEFKGWKITSYKQTPYCYNAVASKQVGTTVYKFNKEALTAEQAILKIKLEIDKRSG